MVKNPQAVAAAQSAIAALGGASFYSTTSGVTAQGNLTAGTGGISGAVSWENAGTEFKYVRPGPNGPITFVSAHGNPVIVDGNAVQQQLANLAVVEFPVHLPAVALAAELNNPNVSFSVQTVTIGGTPAVAVSTVDMTDTMTAAMCQQTWYLNPATFVPFRVDYLAAAVGNGSNTMPTTILLSNYQNVSGFQVPFQIVTMANGQQISQVTLTSVRVAVQVPATDFDPPTTNATAGAQ